MAAHAPTLRRARTTAAPSQTHTPTPRRQSKSRRSAPNRPVFGRLTPFCENAERCARACPCTGGWARPRGKRRAAAGRAGSFPPRMTARRPSTRPRPIAPNRPVPFESS
ncbi:hypothetical protein SF83666_c19600 [Sinorhizobium fredii CCBAU 83666]|nr:hypothetical protein SF83666_c19600 [Sinorhizobium fredii CCBAU 83666]